MEFDLSGASPEDKQRRFVIAQQAPMKTSFRDIGEWLDYFFEMDGIRMGWIGLYHNTEKRHITWNQFYPFCLHLTPEEVVAKGYARQVCTTEEIDFRRRELCDWHTIPKGIARMKLGILAHTLVARHLVLSILQSDLCTTSYFASVETALERLLIRAQVSYMIGKRVPLIDVQSRLTNCAESFGYKFSE